MDKYAETITTRIRNENSRLSEKELKEKAERCLVGYLPRNGDMSDAFYYCYCCDIEVSLAEAYIREAGALPFCSERCDENFFEEGFM